MTEGVFHDGKTGSTGCTHQEYVGGAESMTGKAAS
ncbi:MAG: hypothetical protein BWY75_02327 [bacterium ADurb.Bin425]|nr:MAG: hypothetical protein BWY75_02327 [bacterium ADurb.Bin425]